MSSPNGGFDKPHVEQWTLALQRHYLKLDPIGDAAVLATLEGWLRDELPGACTFHRFAIGASCNHDFEILGAACCSPDRAMAAQAREGFVLGLRVMLGEIDLAAENDARERQKIPPLPASLRYWGGSEQLSSDYEPMRLRAVAGLRLTQKDEEAQRVSGLYFATDAALWALAAAPGPDRRVHMAGHGGLFYGGPALPPVGGRGNHFGQVENEPAFCLLAGIKAEWAENRYGDALPFLRMLNGDFGISDELSTALRALVGGLTLGDRARVAEQICATLSGIRFQERQHFARWADGSVACWVERQPTDLSPSYVAWVYSAGADHAEVGFPFQPDRKNRGKDQSYQLATAAESDGHLVIQGGNAEASPLELPPGAPAYHVVVGPSVAPALEAISGSVSPPATDPGPATDGAENATPNAPPPAKKRRDHWWEMF